MIKSIKSHTQKVIYHPKEYYQEIRNRFGVLISTSIFLGLVNSLTKGYIQPWLNVSKNNMYMYLTILGVNCIFILYFLLKTIALDTTLVRNVDDIPSHYQNIGNYKVNQITIMVDRNNADFSFNAINSGYLSLNIIKQHLRNYRYRVLILYPNHSDVKYYQHIDDIIINHKTLKYYRYHAENEIKHAS